MPKYTVLVLGPALDSMSAQTFEVDSFSPMGDPVDTLGPTLVYNPAAVGLLLVTPTESPTVRVTSDDDVTAAAVTEAASQSIVASLYTAFGPRVPTADETTKTPKAQA